MNECLSNILGEQAETTALGTRSACHTPCPIFGKLTIESVIQLGQPSLPCVSTLDTKLIIFKPLTMALIEVNGDQCNIWSH